MRTTRTAALPVLVLALLACGSPEDAFVGIFDGTDVCTGQYDTGEPLAGEPYPATIRIDRDLSGGIFVAGVSCSVALEVVSATRAEVDRTECDAVLGSGEAVHVTYSDGNATIDGSALFYRRSSTIEADAWTLTQACEFFGERTE